MENNGVILLHRVISYGALYFIQAVDLVFGIHCGMSDHKILWKIFEIWKGRIAGRRRRYNEEYDKKFCLLGYNAE
jgi:hypothetical protein